VGVLHPHFFICKKQTKHLKKVVHFLPKQQSVKSQATDSLDPKVVFVKTLEVANY